MKTILLSALILISIDSIYKKLVRKTHFNYSPLQMNIQGALLYVFSRWIKLFYSSCSQQSNGCFYTWIGYLWRI